MVAFIVSCKENEKVSHSHEVESYNEQFRPQVHFSPPANWMNDPNGMVFFEGEYHLFYQYYPDSTVWGPMHWGHAVSEDLIQWDHLPIALYPDSLGYIFSGSAVIDWDNSSGLGANGQAPMIAIFTHHNMEGEKSNSSTFQYQSIAYSTDKGRTWTKYKSNPVIENPGIRDFRDPKVIWSEEYEKWVMVFAAYDKALFYTSDNLIDWERTGMFGIEGDDRLWECPDLFPIKVEGSNETKWILITSIQQKGPNGGTATSYFVGEFDGSSFIGNSKEQKWLDYGTDNYAFVTWSDIPEEDGRRLGIGWMSNWQYAQVVPTSPWRSAMTMPRELKLFNHDNNYILHSTIVDELNVLREKSILFDQKTYEESKVLIDDLSKDAYELYFKFEIPKKGLINVEISNSTEEELNIGYNVSDQTYFIDRTFAGKDEFSEVFADYHLGEARYEKTNVEMRIIVDRSSIELIADNGRCVMTDIYFPSSPFEKVTIEAEVNEVTLIEGSYTTLRSIW